ncbi:MAG: hypothetical protein AAF830_13925 [Pseudomonadota bacterium]
MPDINENGGNDISAVEYETVDELGINARLMMSKAVLEEKQRTERALQKVLCWDAYVRALEQEFLTFGHAWYFDGEELDKCSGVFGEFMGYDQRAAARWLRYLTVIDPHRRKMRRLQRLSIDRYRFVDMIYRRRRDRSVFPWLKD